MKKQCLLDVALLSAVEKGDLAVVKNLLAQKANADMEVDRSNSVSLLYIAVDNGDMGVTKTLIEAKAKLEGGHSPLHIAVSQGHEGVAKVLIAAKANLEANTFTSYDTPLAKAVKEGHERIAKVLIESKANLSVLEIKNKKGESLLYQAAQKGSETTVKTLLKAKVSIDAKDNNGHTPLHSAAFNGHESVVKLLIDAKAGLSALELKKGNETPFDKAMKRYSALAFLLWRKSLMHQATKLSPLLSAIVSGDENRALSLVQGKASINQRGPFNCQALLLASQAGHVKLLKALLAAGADIEDIKNKLSANALICACILGHTRIVNALIEAKAKLSATWGDNSLLYWAAKSGQASVVKALIEAKANVDEKNKRGNTPLHMTVKEDIAKVLIEAKANVDEKNKRGNTPLHMAVNEDIAKVLIEAKANIEEKNEEGEVPLFAAVRAKRASVVKALIEAKANVNARKMQDDEGRNFDTLLDAATRGIWSNSTFNGRRIILLLIEGKADPNTKKEFRNPLLESFLRRGSIDIPVAKAMIKAGAKLNVLNNRRMTPLQTVITDFGHGHHQAIKVLIEAKANLEVLGGQANVPALYKALIQEKDIRTVHLLIEARANLDWCPPGRIDGALIHEAIRRIKRSDGMRLAHHLLEANVSLLLLGKNNSPFIDDRRERWKSSPKWTEVEPFLSLIETEIKTNVALVAAANKGDVKSMTTLVEQKANLEARDGKSRSALTIVLSAGNTKAAQQLLEMKADPVAASAFAARHNERKMLEELMRLGVNVVSHRYGVCSLLERSIQFDSLDCVRFLVKNYAKVTPQIVAFAKGASKRFLAQALEDETSVERVGQLDRYGNLTVSFSVDYKDLSFDKPLGAGAYGEVTLGTYQFNPVAIKKLKAELFTPALQKEFLQEASVMGSLNSNYLVNLLGVCTQEGHYSMVMEYVDGGSLYDLLKDQTKKLTSTQQLQIAFEMAAGLACLHDRKILHRDLKSLNVLMHYKHLFPSGVTYHAKLCDFGLVSMRNAAQGVNEEKQKNQSVVGTILWMAPELFHGKPQSEASDVYALGLVIWELVTRQVPFAQERKAIFDSLTLPKIEQALKQESCRAMLAAKKLSIPNTTALSTAFTALKKDNFKRKAKTNDEQAIVAVLNFITKQLLAKKMDAIIKAGQLPLPKLPATLDKNLSETIRSCCVYEPQKRPSAKLIANRLLQAIKTSAKQAQESKQESKAIAQTKATPKAMQHIVLVQTEKTVAHHLGHHGLFAKPAGQGSTLTATAEFDVGLTTESAAPLIPTASGASQ